MDYTNALQKFISNLEITKVSAIEREIITLNRNARSTYKALTERTIDILYDHEDAEFKHRAMSYLENVRESYGA